MTLSTLPSVTGQALPIGIVTFLFTNIQVSTKLARQHPEAWEGARARHQHLMPKNYEALKRGFEAAQGMPA